MRFRYWTILAFSLAALQPHTAEAQKAIAPELAPEPFAFKGFLISPSIEIEQRYDSNILVTEDDVEDDFRTSVKPSLVIQKEFGRHSAGIEIYGEIRRFWNTPDENVEKVGGVFTASLEAYKGLVIPIEISYRRDIQERNNRSILSLTEKPQKLDIAFFETGILYKPNRLALEFIGNYEMFRAKDTINRVTGDFRPGADRDTNTATAAFTTWYDTRGWIDPQITVVHERVDDLNPPFTAGAFTGDDRDNNVWRFLAGARLDYKDKILGSIGIGYEDRTYEADSIGNIEAVSVEGDVRLNITPRDSVTFEAKRSTNDDNEILAAYTQTSLGASYVKQVNSRVFLEGSAGYKLFDFDDTRREDEEYEIGGALYYIIDKGLYLEGRYNYKQQDSTQNGLTYDRHIALIGLRKDF